jgi:hypothetical protein
MPRILICTVGGSPVPVVNAIRQNALDSALNQVFFLCSSSDDGAGSDRIVEHAVTFKQAGECPECGKRFSRRVEHAPLAQQAGLEPSGYTIETVSDPDDLRQVVSACDRIAEAVEVRWPDAAVIANYTGGTKTMSFGLGLAALRRGWLLQLNTTGKGRDNLQHIEFGDVGLMQDSEWLALQEAMERAGALEGKHYYAAAVAVLEGIAGQSRLGSDERPAVLEALARCRMRAAWDRFDYEEALRWARQNGGLAREFAARLSRLASVVEQLRGAGRAEPRLEGLLELISDLRGNARRCASKARSTMRWGGSTGSPN